MRAPKRLRDLLQARTHLLGDLVALALRSLPQQVHLDVGQIRPAAQVVMAHQAVEVEGRCRARIGLEFTTSGCCRGSVPSSCATRAVSSSVVPFGMSTITWNSLLLSNGSIFTFTSLSGTSATGSQQQHHDAGKEDPAHGARCQISGSINRR